jgi:hypothetical protein
MMNRSEARAFEAKRRQIAKAGSQPSKPKGPLAPFTANLQPEHRVMQAWRKEAAAAREYVHSGHYHKKPLESLTKAEEFRVMNELDDKLLIAKDKDSELQELGEYVAFMTGTKWIPGPLKEIGGRTQDRGAFQKTVKDYFLDWSANKDLIRGTVAVEDKEDLFRVVARIDMICTPEFGMTLVKRAEQKTKKDEGCGYSGWNFAVVMKGSPIAGEIQANTYSMMYGKMSKTDYTKAILGGNEAGYAQTERRMGFEGGLQHLFYEIYQSKETEQAEKDMAATLSRAYCDLARTNESQRAGAARGITEQVNVFHTKLKSPKAKEIWVKRVLHRYAAH